VENAIAAAFTVFVGLIVLLIFGPVIALIFALVGFLVLLFIALPVALILSPWIIIGLIGWWAL
jgi:hypothetical protein